MVATPQSQLKWEKENTVNIAAKLSKKYDKDIIDYMESQAESKAAIIKKAIRLMIKAETENK